MWKVERNIIAYDTDWQYPVLTEYHAYRQLANSEAVPLGVNYIAFPWANLIDGVNRESAVGRRLGSALRSLPMKYLSDGNLTVCQHIRFREWIDVFRKLGVTDLFASHAQKDEYEIDGVRIHPFPLYPANTPNTETFNDDISDFLARPIKASFVGGYDSRYYLSDTRRQIAKFSALKDYEVLVRDGWHYERAVYHEQMSGLDANQDVVNSEEQREQYYRDVLAKSRFSLCPSGTGPNSIRLWESIEAGAIPVILSDNLALPGEPSIWSNGCLFVKENEQYLNELPDTIDALENNPKALNEKLRGLRRIREMYGRDAFVTDVIDVIERKTKEHTSSTAECLSAHLRDLSRHTWKIQLKPGNLGSADQVVWLLFLLEFVSSNPKNAKIHVDESELENDVRCFATEKLASANRGALCLVSTVPEPGSEEEFVYLASSATLSDKLASSAKTVVIEPYTAPTAVPCRFYWRSVETGWFKQRVTDELVNSGLPVPVVQAARDLSERIYAAKKSVALITSVYDGDRYMNHFLGNCASLVNYDDVEHFLIRADSPGDEHMRLVAHLKAWPSSAVYINWRSDDGLYSVWNYGARIATAQYVSNANLDDRRDPEHTARLVELLNRDEAVSVASAALYVTTRPNLELSEATQERVWYRRDDLRNYGVEWLFDVNNGRGVKSRNMPHCMPVWRRSLHAAHGFFNEKAYGPSADWEFWIRAGCRGARFGLLGKPHGIYLDNPESYWSEQSKGASYDQRIVDRYQGIWSNDGCGVVGNQNRPGDSVWSAFTRVYSAGAAYETLGSLIRLVTENGGRATRERRRLADYWANHIFGVETLSLHVDAWSGRTGDCLVSEAIVLRIAVDLVHDLASRKHERTTKPATLNWWEALFLDYYEVTGGDARGLIGLAFVERGLRGDRDAEASILRKVKQENEVRFWSSVQDVYRFSVGLYELTKELCPCYIGDDECNNAIEWQWIYYYPDYSSRNPYQTLLYADRLNNGVKCVGISSMSEVRKLQKEGCDGCVLHVHWLNAVFREYTDCDVKTAGDRFIAEIKTLQRYGVRVFWTVHNRISHDAIEIQAEKSVRYDLARTVDRVYIHHPMIRNYLDWFPRDVKPWLVEHGSYPLRTTETANREAVRRKFGIQPQERVVITIGQVRPYKGLAEKLQEFINGLSPKSSIKVLVVGKVTCEKVKRMVHETNEDRLLVIDRFVDDEELIELVGAADFGFLAYEEILTSGSMFYLLSAGLPVIAPNKGTIPYYIADYWNGVVYEDSTDLRSVAKVLETEEDGTLKAMSQNALTTATTLAWRF